MARTLQSLAAREQQEKAPQSLPFELRRLVSRSVELLGEIVAEELGKDAFKRIEGLRSAMSELRSADRASAHAALAAWLSTLRALPPRHQAAISRSFTLMLQLMNACENAYRTHRLQRTEREIPSHDRPDLITYVLTAHPSESRSPSNVQLFHELQHALVEALKHGVDQETARIRHLLKLCWRAPIARQEKPRVRDEAEFIYSILLRHETLTALLDVSRTVAPIAIRTWVGGDKDGHSGVDERTMLQSWNLSRRPLLAFIERRLNEVRGSLGLIPAKALERRCMEVIQAIRKLKRVRERDGRRLVAAQAALKRFTKSYRATIGENHPALLELEELSRIFPAWLVPLELRDSSELIVRAATGARVAIRRMLSALGEVSLGGDPTWYASELIISMTSTFEHVRAGETLVAQTLGRRKLPVVPLFEERVALKSSERIVRQMLGSRKPGDALEIMVGYSDSAKEMGALPSRLMLAKTVHRLDRVCRQAGVIPVFFHGSGGSVDRGGGSIEEQTAWMPSSALKRFKATIQGEMIDRTFASPEILRGQTVKLARQLGHVRERDARPASAAVEKFADRVSQHYSAMVKRPVFLEVVEKASAYGYLRTLHIGSRPTKRSRKPGQVTLSSLRAIPWVLSWTQSRALFPTWWGIGSAWKEASPEQRRELKDAFADEAVIRSFVKLLGFTLAKVELPVWRLYLEQSRLPRATSEEFFRLFEAEYDLALDFVRKISGKDDLLWFRPWLGTSIRLRSAMIHPLNLVQLLNRGPGSSERLVRETVTGIASGMLTTG
jgi:phosphoenolpyruvate carboxylase